MESGGTSYNFPKTTVYGQPPTLRFGLLVFAAFLALLARFSGVCTASVLPLQVRVAEHTICGAPIGDGGVTISIVNVTDPSDWHTFFLQCTNLLFSSRRGGGLQRGWLDAPAVSLGPVALYSAWPQHWTLKRQAPWIVVGGIRLVNQAYRLQAFVGFNDGHDSRDAFADVPFIVSTSAGPSISPIDVDRPGFLKAVTSRFVNLNTGLTSIILVLLGLLGSAAKKQISNALDSSLDYAGKFGLGWLATRRFLKRYNDYLRSQHKYLRLIGSQAATFSRPLLKEVFVSLRVAGLESGAPAATNPEEGVSFELAVASYARLTILGAPGAGKTTILSYIVMQYLERRMPLVFNLPNLLPIFVPLRRLSDRRTSILDDILSHENQIIPPDVLREHPRGFLERQLSRGKCIVLLDGLDEVTDERTHAAVAEKINYFIASYPRSRVIVTCRIAGWRNLLADVHILEAKNLSKSEVHRFIAGWHRAIIPQRYKGRFELEYKSNEERAAAYKRARPIIQEAIDFQSRRLIGAIENNPRLMIVARSPLLLSLICVVHLVKRILPRERAVLYEECIDLLIDAWDRDKDIDSTLDITAYQKESILRAVALTFQRSGKGEASRLSVDNLIQNEAERLGVRTTGEELRKQIELRTGILVERSIDVVGFSHLTLQEYLVAKHFQLNSQDASLLEGNFDNREWREVTLLYAGLIDEATSLLRNILSVDSLGRWLLAGYTLGEARRCERGLTDQILDKLVSLFERTPRELRKDDFEVLVDLLASVCMDYTERPETPEQRLSEKLMSYVREGHECAATAISILGRARITQALPLIASLLLSSRSLSKR